MSATGLKRIDAAVWQLPQTGAMRAPGILFGTEKLIAELDEMVLRQVANVASLPGIVKASFAMPDAHWGYGFCIGGVAAFDPQQGGVISAGGVGFDIACGVRTLKTGLTYDQIEKLLPKLADALFRHIPAGVGSTGNLRLSETRLDEALAGGARWAVENGFGDPEDLEYIESGGCVAGAQPSAVWPQAKKRQLEEMGTLGSGNHYLEIQRVCQIFDPAAAAAFGIAVNDILVSIHCGSRGLGHQIGTDYLKEMADCAPKFGISLPEKELACAPLESPLGKRYLGAMRCGINCALANRQILTHLVRQAFEKVEPRAQIRLLYDVSHNTCQEEFHDVEGRKMRLFVHRKGATRVLGAGRAELPAAYRHVGQPVLIGGSMGTASYILVGTQDSLSLAFGSACHGAGRRISRNAAIKQFQGKKIISDLEHKGILIRSGSMRGIAEEAPQAYKDIDEVIEATHLAGLAKKVARVVPLVCVKG